MTGTEIEREVLELAEEDFYGVWEVGWRLRTAFGINPTEEPEVAAGAIESLRKQRLIEIYVREWVDDEPLPIGSTGRTIDLGDPRAWRPPSHGEPQFLIGAPEEQTGEGD